MRRVPAWLAAAAAALASATPVDAQITNYAIVPTSSGSAVAIVDTANLTGTLPLPIGGNPNCSAATSDGRFGYVTTRGGGLVAKVDVAARIVIATLPVGIHPLCIALSPDGTTAWVTDMSANAVRTIDLATFTVAGAAIPVGTLPHGIAVTPDGSRVYVGNYASNTVSVIDTATRSVAATIPVGAVPLSVGVTPDGTEVFSANQSAGTLTRIDVATSTVTSTIVLGGFLETMDFSPDGQTLYVGASLPGGVSCRAAGTGSRVTARWEPRVGGPTHAQTYILVANPGAQPATVTATFLRTSGSTVVKTFTAAPGGRMNIAVTGAHGDVPELSDEEFSVVLDSTQPIVVERSIYSDADGIVWRQERTRPRRGFRSGL